MKDIIDKDPSLSIFAEFLSCELGNTALDDIVFFAARYFEVEYVHIALLQDDLTTVKVVSAILDGKSIDPGYVYPLRGTPCKNVLEKIHTCYSDHVQELFPQDIDLVNLQAESYIGEPIVDNNGMVLGLIVLIGRRKLESSVLVASMMRTLAGRAGIELSRRRMESILRKERETLQLILDYAPIGIWLQDGKGKIAFVNKAFSQAVGIAEEKFLEVDHYIELIPEAFKPQCIASDEKALASTNVSVTQQQLPFIDGHIHDLKVIKAVKRDDEGNPIALVGLSLDITEELRKQYELQKSETRFRTIFNEIDSIAVQGYDENRRVIYWNHASEMIYGYTEDEALGKDLVDLIIPKRMREGVSELHREWITKGIPIPASEITLINKYGEEVQVYSSHILLENMDGKKEMYCVDIDLTPLKNTSKALQENQKLLRTVIDEMPDVLVVKDEYGNFLLCNETVAQLYKTTPEAMIGKHDGDFGVSKEMAEEFRSNVLDIMAKGETCIVMEQSRNAESGKIHHYRSIKKPFKDAQGLNRILVIATDITDIIESQKKVTESEHLLKEVMSIAKEGIWDWHIPSGKLSHNDEWYRSLNAAETDKCATVETFSNMIHPDDKSKVMSLIEALLRGEKENYFSEHRLIRFDGSEMWVQDRGKIIEWDENGVAIRVVGAFTDITYQKQYQKELEHIAHYDTLTGLPNRILNADRLQQGLFQAQRRGTLVAVLYLDLDGFKPINDQYGHDVGNLMLIEISKRIGLHLREGDTLSRLGGDEFVAILTDLSSTAQATSIINRILDSFCDPIDIDKKALHITASIGVTFYPQQEEVDGDQLMRQADLAMYTAKQAGKNRFHIFDSAHDQTIRTRHQSLQKIKNALEQREFVLHYQPKVNMQTGEILGAEALIRWDCPEHGLIYPMEFLPLVEDESLAIDIGEWVISEALSHIPEFKENGLDITISVNVGAKQLLNGNFPERLEYLFHNHPCIDSSRLEIEILETSALEDLSTAVIVIRKCADLGVQFSLDDFGTGYSSLSYLKRLPISTLKIDQSFVRDMENDPDDCVIVQGIIGLAKAFGKKVIAEGVETDSLAIKLISLGCEMGQGYGIARPMERARFFEWAAEWKKKYELS